MLSLCQNTAILVVVVTVTVCHAVSTSRQCFSPSLPPALPSPRVAQVSVYRSFGPTGPLLLGTIFGHSRPVSQFAWTHDDSRIVTVGEDGAAIHWDLHKYVRQQNSERLRLDACCVCGY